MLTVCPSCQAANERAAEDRARADKAERDCFEADHERLEAEARSSIYEKALRKILEHALGFLRNGGSKCEASVVGTIAEEALRDATGTY